MKIIEGQFAGIQIQYKEQKGTRVTTDKVRKAVFDVLKNILDVEGANVVDLFCGSGMYGIESLSRGANSIYFVDDSKSVVDSLKKNIKILDIRYYDIKIINKKFEAFVKSYDEKFDLVFADPPYYNFDFEKLNSVQKILSDNGIFVLESSKRVKIGELRGLGLIIEKKYGDTRVMFFRKI